MKKSRIELLALFNKSKSGKSYLQIVGDQMFLVSEAIMEMVKSGKIDSLTFAKDGELLSETEPADPTKPDGPKKKEFDTFRPTVIEESAVEKLSKVAAIVEAGDKIDMEKFNQYMTMAGTITF